MGTIGDLNKTKTIKKTDWNLRASSEKWALFGDELEKRQSKAEEIITNKNLAFDDRYKMWFNQLDTAARKSIGKTTFKTGGKDKFSHEVKDLQLEKKEAKINIRKSEDPDERT